MRTIWYTRWTKRKNREFKFASIQEALKGIDEEAIATDTVASVNCGRISRVEYYTLECMAR
jgi:hypothetical protein